MSRVWEHQWSRNHGIVRGGCGKALLSRPVIGDHKVVLSKSSTLTRQRFAALTQVPTLREGPTDIGISGSREGAG